jgi:hypothetical protein
MLGSLAAWLIVALHGCACEERCTPGERRACGMRALGGMTCIDGTWSGCTLDAGAPRPPTDANIDGAVYLPLGEPCSALVGGACTAQGPVNCVHGRYVLTGTCSPDHACAVVDAHLDTFDSIGSGLETSWATCVPRDRPPCEAGQEDVCLESGQLADCVSALAEDTWVARMAYEGLELWTEARLYREHDCAADEVCVDGACRLDVPPCAEASETCADGLLVSCGPGEQPTRSVCRAGHRCEEVGARCGAPPVACVPDLGSCADGEASQRCAEGGVAILECPGDGACWGAARPCTCAVRWTACGVAEHCVEGAGGTAACVADTP